MIVLKLNYYWVTAGFAKIEMTDLSTLSREELIALVKQYQTGTDESNSSISTTTRKTPRPCKPHRAFDYSRFARRKIAMKIAYLGWNHDGLASQQDSTNTIESHLFAALEKLKLVKDRSEAEYSRCGRTDKGVSAVCQIVSLLIRSKHPAGTDLTNDISSISDEMDYAHLLNRQLPPSIRVLGWQPVANDFDARFDCQYRQYKYYFPGNRFDLAAMQRAAQYLIGTHDFRNFCKIDFSKGDRQSFERTILHASVQVEQSSDDCGVSGMWSFNIRGTAFIWHQVRCTVALLFLVGRGLEQPEIIRDLLDIQRYPKKPDYKMACGIPLVLWDCGYAEDRLKPFKSDSKESHWLTVESLRDLWRPLACQQYLVHTLFSSILSEWPTVVQADDDNSTTVPWNQMEGDWIKEVQEIERSKHRQLLQKRISGDDETVEQRLKKYQQRKEVKKRQWSAINQNSGDGGR